jgi:hypothetical protein
VQRWLPWVLEWLLRFVELRLPWLFERRLHGHEQWLQLVLPIELLQ